MCRQLWLSWYMLKCEVAEPVMLQRHNDGFWCANLSKPWQVEQMTFNKSAFTSTSYKSHMLTLLNPWDGWRHLVGHLSPGPLFTPLAAVCFSGILPGLDFQLIHVLHLGCIQMHGWITLWNIWYTLDKLIRCFGLYSTVSKLQAQLGIMRLYHSLELNGMGSVVWYVCVSWL